MRVPSSSSYLEDRWQPLDSPNWPNIATCLELIISVDVCEGRATIPTYAFPYVRGEHLTVKEKYTEMAFASFTNENLLLLNAFHGSYRAVRHPCFSYLVVRDRSHVGANAYLCHLRFPIFPNDQRWFTVRSHIRFDTHETVAITVGHDVGVVIIDQFQVVVSLMVGHEVQCNDHEAARENAGREQLEARRSHYHRSL